MNQAVG